MTRKRFMSISTLLRVTLLLVGIHSIVLGGTIYFFTTPFYQFFFSVDPDNYFFIKQSGIFLYLAGLFYLVPAININRYKLIIVLTVISKVTAVAFLLVNANLAPSPLMIYLAALGDCTMAIAIVVLTFLWHKDSKASALA